MCAFIEQCCKVRSDCLMLSLMFRSPRKDFKCKNREFSNGRGILGGFLNHIGTHIWWMRRLLPANIVPHHPFKLSHPNPFHWSNGYLFHTPHNSDHTLIYAAVIFNAFKIWISICILYATSEIIFLSISLLITRYNCKQFQSTSNWNCFDLSSGI